MSEQVDAWVMPFKSQEFERGPELTERRGDVALRLDFETETGEYAWLALEFKDVSAYSFTAWRSCNADQINAYDRVVEVLDSEWIRRLPRLPDGTKHFRVFFDERGCYELLAGRFNVNETAAIYPRGSAEALDRTDRVDVELTSEELRLLTAGLAEWGGPARCTEPLAVAMGFIDVSDFFRQSRRIAELLRAREPLSRPDWTRALLATEIVFASDVVGSGWDWQSTVGWSDDETIAVLRGLQSKLMTSRAISVDVLL